MSSILWGGGTVFFAFFLLGITSRLDIADWTLADWTLWACRPKSFIFFHFEGSGTGIWDRYCALHILNKLGHPHWRHFQAVILDKFVFHGSH
jgi:hypothetical protein